MAFQSTDPETWPGRRRSAKAKDIKKGKCGVLKNGACACRLQSGRLRFSKLARCKR